MNAARAADDQVAPSAGPVKIQPEAADCATDPPARPSRISRSPIIHPEVASVKSMRVQGEKIDLGRVQVDFTPEWISDPTSQRKIAVPRARITIRGSDKVLEIRDLERIQRLRKVMKRAEPIAVTGLR
jgi:hypothetical protein